MSSSLNKSICLVVTDFNGDENDTLWNGIMTPLYSSEYNQSQSKYLDIWLNANNVYDDELIIHVDIGHINEDWNDNGILDTEDEPVYGPGMGDGILSDGEDIGVDNCTNSYEDGWGGCLCSDFSHEPQPYSECTTDAKTYQVIYNEDCTAGDASSNDINCSAWDKENDEDQSYDVVNVPEDEMHLIFDPNGDNYNIDPNNDNWNDYGTDGIPSLDANEDGDYEPPLPDTSSAHGNSASGWLVDNNVRTSRTSTTAERAKLERFARAVHHLRCGWRLDSKRKSRPDSGRHIDSQNQMLIAGLSFPNARS